MKQICILFASLLMCTAAEAQNYAAKLKKAKGIEVTYHSLYKGKVNPGSTVMKVFGDHVKLESVWPESKKDKKKEKAETPKPRLPRRESYIDYSRQCSYRRAIMPNNELIYTNIPFEYGKGFKELREEKYLGLNCKVVRTVVN